MENNPQHNKRHRGKHRRQSAYQHHNHDQMGHDIVRLSDIEPGEKVVIIKVLGHGAFRKRITEMGFVKGKVVEVIKNAPLMDPVEYQIMGYNISLRRTEADMIEVVYESMGKGREMKYEGTSDKPITKACPRRADKIINIALVGNPNCGKTTLFNYASGSKERVGNYSGVTVESKEAKYKHGGYVFNIADLPGTYSITDYSPEELYVREYITEKAPDIIINVVDSSNLERNLFLTTQLIDMNVKIIVALNMYDELLASGAKFDYEHLGKMIGIPFIPTVASKGTGITELFDKAIEVHEDKDPTVRKVNINYGNDIEKAIGEIEPFIEENRAITAKYDSRYLSIKMLEGEQSSQNLFNQCQNCSILKKACHNKIDVLEKEYKEKSESLITDAKYGFIAGALKETYIPPRQFGRKHDRMIDNVLTHKLWGIPIFLAFLFLTFKSTFTLGAYPMSWIDAAVGYLGAFLQSSLPDGWIKALVVDGIIGGVGSVIIFLPNILILFFCISLMEDTGYMARASFIMDKLMHKIGLHGRSFIPLVMGFGCNVPAIMATRTLNNKNDRLLTILIIPFMSCSARLPVYVLLIGAFFPSSPAIALFSIYFIGIVLATVSGIVFKKLLFSKEEAPFVMELPPYRIPTAKNIALHTWDKGVEYLKKMGGIILVASIIIWALGYFPRETGQTTEYTAQITNINNDSSLSQEAKAAQIKIIGIDRESERLANSYIGKIGHFIEPVVAPLGFDWKIGVSILSGLAAKEIIVSSIGVLYHADYEEGNNKDRLIKSLKKQDFSPLTAYSLLLFILIYFPCIAVIAAIKREANLKWAIFTMVYTTSLAWIISFLVYQIGSLFV